MVRLRHDAAGAQVVFDLFAAHRLAGRVSRARVREHDAADRGLPARTEDLARGTVQGEARGLLFKDGVQVMQARV